MSLVFFGLRGLGSMALNLLLERGVEIDAVVAPNDRPSWRGRLAGIGPLRTAYRRVRPTGELDAMQDVASGSPSIDRVLAKHRWRGERWEPSRLTDTGVATQIGNLPRPRIGIVVTFDTILKPDIIRLFDHLINFHPSILPHYRGATPIPWLVMAGEKVGGVTAHLIDEGVDTGPILDYHKITISESDTTGVVYDRLLVELPNFVVKVVGDYSSLLPVARPQSEGGSRQPRFNWRNACIHWGQDGPEEIQRRMLASLPMYGAGISVGRMWVGVCETDYRDEPGTEAPGVVLRGKGLTVRVNSAVAARFPLLNFLGRKVDDEWFCRKVALREGVSLAPAVAGATRAGSR